MDEYSSKSQALGFEYIDSAMAYVADGSFQKYPFASGVASVKTAVVLILRQRLRYGHCLVGTLLSTLA